jgi:hypothetical protein
VALATAAFVDEWRIPFLGDKTLRECARETPSNLDIHGQTLAKVDR